MHTMTPAEHRQLREAAKLTQDDLANAMGITRVTVNKRERADKPLPIPAPVALLLRYIERYGPPERALAIPRQFKTLHVGKEPLAPGELATAS